MTHPFSFVHFVMMDAFIFFLFWVADGILTMVVMVTAMMVLIRQKSGGICIDFADLIKGV